jgi:transcriptional regulator with XRE-family HTH domain
MKEKKIGKRLALFRKARALTQCELAQIIGISQSTLTDYERDKLRLHDSLIVKISQALKISADELLGIKNNVNIE